MLAIPETLVRVDSLASQVSLELMETRDRSEYREVLARLDGREVPVNLEIQARLVELGLQDREVVTDSLAPKAIEDLPV